MSWNPALEPGCPDDTGADAIETLIIPRTRDLGGFEVRRALPAPRRQMVGPFIFFDQAGPAEFLTGAGIDVRPHPHIGLGTVTYLYRGDFHHRDSIGSDQIIRPGELNWMVAGRGVTHSERTSAQGRAGPHSLFGIQTWVALPEGAEDNAPVFEHHGTRDLPVIENEGVSLKLILGHAYGEKAPATVYSETFYADVQLQPGARFPLPDDHEDRGIYVSEGSIAVAGQTFEAGRMMVFRPGDTITVAAGERGARLMILGGATLNGPRYVWWNFVASSHERITAAKEAWKAQQWGKGTFDLPVGDRDEFIPLPDAVRVQAATGGTAADA
ncbi:pirin family protein [Pseudochelatococcus lubricantis]|uniref:pirin family protein n=1 Tax=Pseudochelatococcus lubricantis TaxID=1538102 RepID=UPI0035E76781